MPPGCDDGEQNGEETDVDCGGAGACERCAGGKKCTDDSDCQSAACISGSCCTLGTDTDGDGKDDCSEMADDDPWTDPEIFNGVHAVQMPACLWASLVDLECSSITTTEVSNCVGEVREQKNQTSGWDWVVSSDDICNSDYGFSPNWTECTSEWQVRWTSYLNLNETGQHCFRILGSGCQTFYFNNSSVVTGKF